MTTLYNCKHAGDQYKVTKFDDSFNVESSYLCTIDECECPAGVRPSCRHRSMLRSAFLLRDGAIDGPWFYDYDRQGWVNHDLEPEIVRDHYLDGIMAHSPEIVSTSPDLPYGVEIVSLNDPVALHNAIARAVGEPAPAPRKFRRGW